MSWLEEELQFRKTQYERELYENDYMRWLQDAHREIRSEGAKDCGLAGELRVFSNLGENSLLLSANNNDLGRYILDEHGFHYEPILWFQENPETMFGSEEEFREHLCDMIWASRKLLE